jgi:hypothetical protein
VSTSPIETTPMAEVTIQEEVDKEEQQIAEDIPAWLMEGAVKDMADGTNGTNTGGRTRKGRTSKNGGTKKQKTL